jgi:hypothetical protein
MQISKYLVVVSTGAVLLLGASCTSDSAGPTIGSESHYLQSCLVTSDCSEGLSCSCGICTVSCSSDDTCQGLGSAKCGPKDELQASCADGGSWTESICVAECTEDAQCQAIDATMSCSSGGWCQPQGWDFMDNDVVPDAEPDADGAQRARLPSAPVPVLNWSLEPQPWEWQHFSGTFSEGSGSCTMESEFEVDGDSVAVKTWRYDSEGRLVELAGSRTLTLIYDGSHLSQKRLELPIDASPNLMVFDYTYNDRGRLQTETRIHDGTLETVRTYAYDRFGRVEVIIERDRNDQERGRMEFTYDDLQGRLRAEVFEGATSSHYTEVQFDEALRVVSYVHHNNDPGLAVFGSNPWNFSLSYDESGRLARKAHVSSTEAQPEVFYAYDYSYDEAGRLVEVMVDPISDVPAVPPGSHARVVLSYGADGGLAQISKDYNSTGTVDQVARFSGPKCRVDQQDLELWGRSRSWWGTSLRLNQY